MRRYRKWVIFGSVALGILIVILSWNVGLSADAVEQPIMAAPLDCQGELRFAVIGDFGQAGKSEADVAALVRGWDVDLIVTTGDNNYPNGEADTIDANIGQYYSDYIYPYRGEYGPGATENRFFPTLGNHDWHVASLKPHYDYFTLPGNERYYDFERGPVHFFIVDSDPHEPDGRTQDSVQAAWLEEGLRSSSTPWQLVFLHHPPYSSSAKYGSDVEVQWPFAAWGADAVFAGHAHLYERLNNGEIPFFVNGLGGRRGFLFQLHRFGSPVKFSQVRYNSDFGAQLITADETCINFRLYNRHGDLIDSYTLHK